MSSNPNLWIQVPIILLSFAYGIALAYLLAWIIGRTYYLIATSNSWYQQDRHISISDVVHEARRPSKPEECEAIMNIVGKVVGVLYGLTFTATLFTASRSAGVKEYVDSFGLLAVPMLPTIAVVLTALEVLLLLGMGYVCCSSRTFSLKAMLRI